MLRLLLFGDDDLEGIGVRLAVRAPWLAPEADSGPTPRPDLGDKLCGVLGDWDGRTRWLAPEPVRDPFTLLPKPLTSDLSDDRLRDLRFLGVWTGVSSSMIVIFCVIFVSPRDGTPRCDAALNFSTMVWPKFSRSLVTILAVLGEFLLL